MIITYLGHSAFEIQTGRSRILIDPFLERSPKFDTSATTDILVTHGHQDHLGGAIDISKATGAPITAVHELALYCSAQGAKATGMNVGGWVSYDWGRACAVPAAHSSSTPDGVYAGCPVGFILEIEGKTLYYAGDTGLMSDMIMIGDVYQPELAFLPIGGHYTMGIDHAPIAAEWLGVDRVIPMHYNTFPPIQVDIADFVQAMQSVEKTPIVLDIGATFEF